MAGSSSATSPRAMSRISTTATTRQRTRQARPRIYDGIAPLVTDAEGNLLPIRAFHSVGNRDGFNFLNPVAGENALASEVGDGLAGVEVVSFEDGLATTDDFDGDFDDAFVAVSDAPLSGQVVSSLVEETGISRRVGTDGPDRLVGTDEDDQLIALDGNDVILGRGGDDQIEASDGNDRAYGGAGEDEISGEEGHDRLFGGEGRDEIEGGEGRDGLRGGSGRGRARRATRATTGSHGGSGFDELEGGEGNDRLLAGGGGARMSGGAGDDILYGEAGAEDVFVFDLIPFGDDLIRGFENGRDRIEIATYTDVESFDGYRRRAGRAVDRAELRGGNRRDRQFRLCADRRVRLPLRLTHRRGAVARRPRLADWRGCPPGL